jgi:hypothetical protein
MLYLEVTWAAFTGAGCTCGSLAAKFIEADCNNMMQHVRCVMLKDLIIVMLKSVV